MTTREVTAREVIYHGVIFHGVITRELITHEMINHEFISNDVITREAITREVTAREVITYEVQGQELEEVTDFLLRTLGGKAEEVFGMLLLDQANRILDFFNRETISGVPFTGQTKPKLWRDFTGGGPSLGMAQAMRSVASNTEAIDGLVQAKTQFVDLIADLEAEGTPEAQTEMRDLIDSLARICTNIGHPIG